ncbi:unnamed protein product [Calypogeia fissa]
MSIIKRSTSAIKDLTLSRSGSTINEIFNFDGAEYRRRIAKYTNEQLLVERECGAINILAAVTAMLVSSIATALTAGITYAHTQLQLRKCKVVNEKNRLLEGEINRRGGLPMVRMDQRELIVSCGKGLLCLGFHGDLDAERSQMLTQTQKQGVPSTQDRRSVAERYTDQGDTTYAANVPLTSVANVPLTSIANVPLTSIANVPPTSIANVGPPYVASVPPISIANVGPTSVANVGLANVSPTYVVNVPPTSIANVGPTSVVNAGPTSVANVGPTSVANVTQTN